MKLLLIGGNMPNEQIDIIMKNTIGNFQFAANEFQNKLISGLKKQINDNFYILSAPFINPYPKGYKKLFYKKYIKNKNEKYVGFLNLWGIRNISRKKNLIKEAKYFLNLQDKEKIIIVYSPHVPFLETACYLKKTDPNIKIILLLPDLPQFVALEENVKILYKILKPFDVKKFYKFSEKFDAYILLTEQMNDFVNKNRNKPFLIVEGIANSDYINSREKRQINSKYTIAYTGTLHKKFGIENLIEAFMLIKNDSFRLEICGDGDAEEYVKNASKKDSRIHYLGQVNNETSLKIQREADLLVNPRQNVGDFTKYSFPSKNIEYLASGNPVIAYKLDGIPEEYNDLLFYPENNSIEELKNRIVDIKNMSDLDKTRYKNKLKVFLKRKEVNVVSKNIINFCEEVNNEENY